MRKYQQTTVNQSGSLAVVASTCPTSLEPPAKRGLQKGVPAALPSIGMSRWDTLKYFVPISRETWRKLVNSGKAPKPVKLSERCTMYPNAEVHRWLNDPAAYRTDP